MGNTKSIESKEARNYLEAAGSIIVSINSDESVRFINRAGAKMLGYSQAEMVGTNWFDNYLPKRNIKTVRAVFQRILKNKKPLELHSFENPIITKNGEERIILWSNALFRGAEGNLVSISSGEDVTQIKKTQQALQESEQKYSKLVENSLDGILIMQDGVFKFANQSALKMLGYTYKELLGKNFSEIVAPEQRRQVIAAYNKFLQGKPTPQLYEIAALCKGGARKNFEIFISLTDYMGAPASLVYAKDIDLRKKSEQRLERLNRLYNVLINSNQAMVRLKSVSQISNAICRIIVQDGGMKMAWLGIYNPRTKFIVPTAHYGADKGYLKRINVSGGYSTLGRGPTGTAFRTGKPFVCNDWSTSDYMKPWFAEGSKRGYRSSASLPIFKRKQTIGALSIYSQDPGFFDDEIMKLLRELALDISFALESVENEELRQATESSLSEARKRLEQIVKNTPDVAIETYDLNGTVLSWNRAAEKIFGWKSEEAIGKRIDQLMLDRKLSPLFLRQLLQMKKSNASIRPSEWEFARKDGSRGWVYSTMFPLSTEGQAGEFVCMDVDITERKKAERTMLESEAKFKLVFEYNPSAVYIEDLNGIIISCNRAAEKMTGYRKWELVGMNARALVPPEVGKTFANIVKKQLGGGSYFVDTFNLKKSGEKFPVQVYIKPITVENKTLAFVIVRDLTEQKRIESLTRDYTYKLRSEVDLRTKELSEEKSKVEELSIAKDRFLRDVGHELKTPLSVILGNLFLLKDMAPIGKESEWAKILELLERNAVRLSSSINQLLQMSKMSSVSIRRDRIFVHELLKNIQMEYLPLVEMKGLKLTLDAEPFVMVGDRELLQIAVSNLVSNAVKFTSKGSIAISALARAERVVISVRDTGSGIPKKHISSLFTKFFKADPSAPGTGIGLTITREIIEKHGGSIRVKSKLGEGSTFEIELLREPPERKE